MNALERWRPVVGWVGFYEVSDLGGVRSVDRVMRNTRHPGYVRNLRGRPIRSSPDRHGYPYVTLSRDGRATTVKVHTLVLRAFTGPPPEGMEARHLDDDPANPRWSNLVWGTRSENILDQVLRGTHVTASRTHCPLEHPLATPNLDPGHARLGRRQCLACVQAHKAAYRARQAGRVFDFEAEAHRRYALIEAKAGRMAA